MMEDCATSMSAPHGCNDDTAVIDSFKEALTGRVGAERFRMWFAHGVTIAVDSGAGALHADASVEGAAPQGAPHERLITLSVRGQFALDRLRQNFIREIRGAAMQACGGRTEIVLRLDEPTATQAQLPLTDDASSKAVADDASVSQIEPTKSTTSGKRSQSSPSSVQSQRKTPQKSARGRTQSITTFLGAGSSPQRAGKARNLRIDQAEQLEFPGLNAKGGSVAAASSPSSSTQSATRADRDTSQKASAQQDQQQSAGAEDVKRRPTVANFVAGTSNQLAYTALSMVCQEPKTASPIFFCGPTGTGKTHLMSAIAEQLRRRHRMRRVMHLSAEQFTNDFISSVGNSGITAFRRRYREVDALLIDDVQFLGAKKATLREMLYTVETLASEGRPLLFSGLQAPSEIDGLSHELAGRMASGLVCPIQPLDIDIRREILERWIAERCPLEVPAGLLDQINPMLAGDGRVVSGLVNMINTLQRMFGRVPSLDEIRQFGGNLLRASTPVATLSVIETAVCDAFHLPHHTLRGRTQTRAVTGPRMLAMYLARQLTSSAYSEIATHFGGKSHSTAISAENNVKKWLASGKSIGRGQLAMSTREAVARVENLLRSG
jgi:chromosomal replication initiator protein